MSRIRKKIEKRAAKLLIQSTIFKPEDYCPIENCFYFTDYFGECDEINPWNYLEDLAIKSSIKCVVCDMDTGLYNEIGKISYPTIIQTIKLFKENYLK